MARFCQALASSDAATVGSISSRSSQRKPAKSRTRAAGSRVTSINTSVIASAPALMNGLRGTPPSASSSDRWLNGVPDGSLPTRVQVSSPRRFSARPRAKTLVMLWTEKPSSASPITCSPPSTVRTAMPNLLPGTVASSGM